MAVTTIAAGLGVWLLPKLDTRRAITMAAKMGGAPVALVLTGLARLSGLECHGLRPRRRLGPDGSSQTRQDLGAQQFYQAFLIE